MHIKKTVRISALFRTAGQSLVVYDGDTVICGGEIK